MFDDGFQLKKRIIADRAVWKNGRWIFYNVIENDFTGTSSFSTMKYPIRYVSIKETPDDFKIAFEKDAAKMSYRELSMYADNLEKKGYDTTRYRVDMQAKLSYPLACLIMSLIATPFALMVGRKGGLGTGVVISRWCRLPLLGDLLDLCCSRTRGEPAADCCGLDGQRPVCDRGRISVAESTVIACYEAVESGREVPSFSPARFVKRDYRAGANGSGPAFRPSDKKAKDPLQPLV